MATVHLGRSEEQFWKMTPRKLFAMIGEWNALEKFRAKILGFSVACFMNGKNPDDIFEVKQEKRIAVSREQRERNARMLF